MASGAAEESTPCAIESFPFSQVIVIGGTGTAGQRIVDLFVPHREIRILATSRAVSGELPSGPLAATVTQAAGRWKGRVTWAPLNLESEPSTVESQLQAMQRHLKIGEPLALFVAAAFTNVEGCEEDPARNRRVNISNTVQVLEWGRKLGAHLVFFSTDYVFDGTAGPYNEETPRNALTQYGLAKAQVEEWLEAQAPETSVIIRTTGVYDYIPGSKNFLMQMLEIWGQGRSTRVPKDQWANPVWAVELAKAAAELVALKAKGIFNVAGGEYMARHQFAQAIAHVFGYDQNLVVPVETKELNQKAQRPLKGGLRCDKLKNKLGWAPGSPEAVLGLLKWTHKH